MFSFRRSKEFDVWLRALSDLKGKARILARLTRAEQGNLGDCKPIGAGVSEMRIKAGPGYRVYFVQEGRNIYLLLVGGDKGSQKRDIARAKTMARELKKEAAR